MQLHALRPLTLLILSATLVGGCFPANPGASQNLPVNDRAARHRFDGTRGKVKSMGVRGGGGTALQGGPGMGMRGGPGMGMGFRGMAETLNLSETQQTQFDAIRDAMHDQRDEIQSDPKLTDIQREEKMMQLGQDTRQKMMAILTVSQRKQWDEIRRQREAWRQNNSPGEDPNGPA